jgi:polyhydroxyalkanoate synthesis repressor PhaR
MAILIKRYANRKLYNTDTSRYITLKGIAGLLEDGEEVRVVDNETGEDITQVALSQILVDNKRAKQDPSETLLTQILSRGGDALYGAIRKSVDDASDGIGEFQDRFRDLVGQSDSGSASRSGLGFVWDKRAKTRRRHDQNETAADEADSGQRLDEAMRSDLDRIVRESVKEAINALDLPSRKDLDALNRNFERVATAVERLGRAYLPDEQVTTHANKTHASKKPS